MTFIISTMILIFSEKIVTTVLGKQFLNSIDVLRILSYLPFMIGISNILGIQTMLSFNLKKTYLKILMTAGLLNLLFLISLTPKLMHIGVAISMILTESIVTSSMAIYLIKIKIWKRLYEKV